jgi:tRNA/tmRNA/rRNA uracil-C5-methylase (TrmA/RlmC/RlmD family)
VTVQHCLVANPTVNRLLQALPAKLLLAPDLQGLREIEIDADSHDHVGLCFYFAAHPGEKVLSALRTTLLDEEVTALRIRLSSQRPKRSAMQYDEPDGENMAQWQELCTAGELTLKLHSPAAYDGVTSENLELAYLPGDFTQTHWEINAALVARALDWLRPRSDEIALDLFSGIGNFSLPMARRAKTVHALEGNSSMAARITSNAARNGIYNVNAKVLDLMAEEVVLPRADIAIVDPPRAGAKAVCAALTRSKIRRVVYVSCHPATLLRDARVLHSAGLRLVKAAAVDMFAHTGHSEAIALFELQ